MTLNELLNESYDEGQKKGIFAFISEFSELGLPKENIVEKLIKHFPITLEDAIAYYNEYATI